MVGMQQADFFLSMAGEREERGDLFLLLLLLLLREDDVVGILKGFLVISVLMVS